MIFFVVFKNIWISEKKNLQFYLFRPCLKINFLEEKLLKVFYKMFNTDIFAWLQEKALIIALKNLLENCW